MATSPTTIPLEIPMPRTATRAASPAKRQTALEVLKAEHAEVKKLFTQFDKMKKNKDKTGMQRIAQAVCKALTIHARIEEEIFYPALREAASADAALDEADVEHTHLKELVAQIETSQPGDALFEARFEVLSEYVEHHVQEEESTIFSKARTADFDLKALGEQLLARKEELGGRDQPIDVAVLAQQKQAPKRNGQRPTR
jgi:hemerythrin superfamily protein